MTEQEAISRMIAPGTPRIGKYRNGVIQIWVTRACDKSCFGCTQGSNLAGNPGMISPDQFEQAVLSLKDYWGVVGVFGGNPAMHPQFEELCGILTEHIPYEQRGIWCNNPLGKAKVMRQIFNPAVSNLNVHLDQQAYAEFKRDWPECHVVGLHDDSRHSPPFISIKDVIEDEEERWKLISDCDINKHWSAMIGVFRGEVRAWFCEIAGAQAMLHQYEPDYPDTGLDPTHSYNTRINTDNMERGEEVVWWKLPITAFTRQIKKHCQECGIPLRGYGELSQAYDGTQNLGLAVSDPHPREQTSETHANIYKPKRRGREVEVVNRLEQLGLGKIKDMTRYLQNARV